MLDLLLFGHQSQRSIALQEMKFDIHSSIVLSSRNAPLYVVLLEILVMKLFKYRYALKPYMLTPVLDVTNPSEEAYNRSLTATRATIERAFGVWKGRFR